MEIINNLLESNLTTKIFVTSSIIVLGLIQFFIFKLNKYLQFAFILFLHLLFGLLLMKISVYNLKVHCLLYILPSLLFASLLYLVISLKQTTVKSTNPWGISLEYVTKSGKKIINYNPFNGIFVCAGPGSGKTLTFVKPTIEQFAKFGLPGIVYDYKRLDLTKTAYTNYIETKIPVKVIDFVDLNLTNKVNPLDPKLLISPAYAKEFAHILFENTQNGASQKDPFFIPSAEGILSGVIWKLKEDEPQHCNIPYAVAICLYQDYKAIASFIQSNRQASLLASSFLQVVDSDKTATSITATLSNAMSKFALPELFYTLSGSDFSLDLNNPSSPTMMCINNYKPLEESLSPIIALIICVALKNMNNPGKLPSCVLIDEGSSMKLPNFDNTPATGRENGLISMFVVQDKRQVEARYGNVDSDNIINNCMMHIYGLTRNGKAAKEYAEMMGHVEKEYVSRTRGSNSHSSTVSVRTETKYKSDVFTELGVGEFYGLIANGNVKKFNSFFKPYNKTDLSLPLVNNVSHISVQQNFSTILQNAEALINSQIF